MEPPIKSKTICRMKVAPSYYLAECTCGTLYISEISDTEKNTRYKTGY